MNTTKRTEISSLGEFGFIERLTKDVTTVNKETVKGIGDDAAILQFGSDEEVLITTDLFMEGVHFDLTYFPLKHLGYKVVVANISDIYAMNGTPKQITVSLGISRKFCIEDIEELYSGIRLACEQYGVDIVGGDTTSSLTGLAISITAIGDAPKDKVVYRNGAKETDLICVSGNLGAAYMGLHLLERERIALDGHPNPEPDFAGHEYILRRWLKPDLRLDIIKALEAEGIIPTAMIDITDGLASDALQLCKASGCGAHIYLERIPIAREVHSFAEELNSDPVVAALNGGDDHELLFTVPIADHEKVSTMKDVHIIGHIVSQDMGNALITRDGVEMELKAQGWNNQQ